MEDVEGILSPGIIRSSSRSPKRCKAHSDGLPVKLRKAATSAPFAAFWTILNQQARYLCR
jgi:hypothetical protein